MRIIGLFVFLAMLHHELGSATDMRVTRIVIMSDIHYDDRYGMSDAVNQCEGGSLPPLGKPGCDSPLALVKSAFRDVFETTKPDILIIAGDWLRHDMSELPESAGSSIFSTVVNALVGEQAAANRSSAAALISAPKSGGVSAATGNNDYVPDYFFDVAKQKWAPSSLLSYMSQTLHDKGLLSSSQHQQFSSCAFYSHRDNRTQTVVIVLNSLVWSLSLDPVLDASNLDPCGQFVFLESALSSTMPGDTVFVVGHIPPTMNFYDVATSSRPWNGGAYWRDDFAERFCKLVRQHQERITAVIFAHTHHMTFVADQEALGSVPLFINGAVSPVYFNNPSYLVLEVDPLLSVGGAAPPILSLQQRLLNINDPSGGWRNGETLQSAYSAVPTVQSLSLVSRDLRTMSKVFDTWWSMFNANLTMQDFCTTSLCLNLASCYSQSATAQGGLLCWERLNNGSATSAPAPPSHRIGTAQKVVILLVFLLSLVLTVCVVSRCLRSRNAASASYGGDNGVSSPSRVDQLTEPSSSAQQQHGGEEGVVRPRSVSDETPMVRSDGGLPPRRVTYDTEMEAIQ